MSERLIEMAVVPTTDPKAPDGLIAINARHVRAVHLCGCPGNHAVVHMDDGVALVCVQRESYVAVSKAVAGESEGGSRSNKQSRGLFSIVDVKAGNTPCDLIMRFGHQSGGEALYLTLSRGHVPPAPDQGLAGGGHDHVGGTETYHMENPKAKRSKKKPEPVIDPTLYGDEPKRRTEEEE